MSSISICYTVVVIRLKMMVERYRRRLQEISFRETFLAVKKVV